MISKAFSELQRRFQAIESDQESCLFILFESCQSECNDAMMIMCLVYHGRTILRDSRSDETHTSRLQQHGYIVTIHVPM